MSVLSNFLFVTAYIEYYDDPKGAVPSWLVNWAAKVSRILLLMCSLLLWLGTHASLSCY